MALERFVTLVRTRGLVTDAVLDAARRSLAESDEDASAFRLASVLVERGAIGETTAQELLAASVASDREGGAPGAGGAGGRGLEGRVIGNWRVARKLSEGGMGAVYLAEHNELGKRAALKVVLDEHGGDTELLARFENEARVLARVRHPNVVDVLDFGRDGDRRFILMEYVDGKSLSEILEGRGAVPPREAAAWARDAARGLAAIHGAGLVHRDIKPSNILVGESGVKIVDFGVVRELDRSIGLTLSGLVVGTPLYMSPEQARGKKVDARSDVYALGATLYHLVAGEPPFNADSALGVLMKHIHERPPRAPLERKDVPAALTSLILRMLAKEARARPESAAEVADALDAFLVSPEKRAGAASAGDRAPPPPARRRAAAPRGSLAGAAAGLAVAAIGMGALVAWLSGEGGGGAASVGGGSGAPGERAGSSERAASPSAGAAVEARDGEAETKRLLSLAAKKEAAGKLIEARALLEAALAARPDPEVQKRLRTLESRIAREEAAARRRPSAPTATGGPVLFGEAPAAPTASATVTAAAGGAIEPASEPDEPPRRIFGGRRKRIDGPRADEGAAALRAEAEADEAAAAATTAELSRIEEAVRLLGSDAPLAPKSSHDDAIRAVEALRPALASDDAIARLDWEVLRRRAAAEVAAGFIETLVAHTGSITAVSRAGAFRIEGKLRAMRDGQLTLAVKAGGEVAIPLAEMTLADVVATRASCKTIRAVAGSEDAATGRRLSPDARPPLANTVALAEAGDLKAALEMVREVRAGGRPLEAANVLMRREVARIGELVRGGRLVESWGSLTSDDAIAARMPAPHAEACARLRASFPWRIMRRLETLPEGHGRAEAPGLRKLLASVMEREGAAFMAAPALVERTYGRLLALSPAGEWLEAPHLGLDPVQSRFWSSFPRRGVESKTADAVWTPVPISPDLLAISSGVCVQVRRDRARQAGFIFDHDGASAAGIIVYVAHTYVGWAEYTGPETRTRGESFTIKKGAPESVELTAQIHEGQLVISYFNDRLASLPWSRKAVRGMGLYVAEGDMDVEKVHLKRAP